MSASPPAGSGARLYLPDWTLVDGALVEGQAVLVDGAGRIVRVGAREAAARCETASRAARVPLPGRALLPGLVNGHSHCWQVLLRGLGDDPADFAAWVRDQLYPTVERLDLELFSLAARLGFAEMLRSGITTVGEFHYVHHGPEGADAGDAYDLAVLDAAEAVGIRVVLARTMYDRGTRPGQARFRETPEQAREACLRMAKVTAARPRASFLPAPHSLHGASRGILEAADAVSRELGTRFHIHLAEQEGDREVSRELHGAPPLGALEALGMLDARTVLIHGIWMEDEEVRRLGEAGGALVYNPGTNMLLGDGVAPIPAYLDAGVAVGLGTDANSRPDLLEELRLAEYLQRLRALGMNALPRRLADRGGLLSLATRGGAAALGLDVGQLAPGTPADMVAVDVHAPSLQPAAGISGEAILHALVHSGRLGECVDRVWVDGALVVDRGAPTRVPLGLLSREVAARAGERLVP